MACSLADLLPSSLRRLVSSDVERDGHGHHDHDDTPEDKQGLASRPVGADLFPFDVVPVYHPLRHSQVGKGGENEASEGCCDSSREV